MSTANERGALGKRFHDLPSPADNPELAWENIARNILLPRPPEEEPRKKRRFFWWWFSGAVALLVAAFLWWYPVEYQGPQPEEEPEVTALIETAEKGRPAMATLEEVGESPSVFAQKADQEEVVNGLDSEVLPPVVGARLANPMPAGPTQDKPILKTNMLPQKTVVEDEPFSRDLVPTDQLSARAILPLSYEGKSPTLEVEPELPEESTGQRSSVALAFGAAAFQSGYEGAAPWLRGERNELSPELSLRYERPVLGQWFFSTGVDLRTYRFRTAFENVDENARLYRPGTVDTIFRNLTTGEERIVYTDTVPGTIIRRFGNDNTVTEIGMPILLGRRWQLGNHGFSLAAGPRLGMILTRQGRTVAGENVVVDLEDAPQFGQSFRWNARAEV
ncbi:MAG: hypothetical protein AAGA62_08930, partial [Bacteroidota bacterium]